MPHPPTVCAIEVDLTRVLWLTRGWRWDYVFLLKPRLSVGHAWADLQWRIFAGISPGPVPYSVAGVVIDLGGSHPFLATTFLDPHRCDARGRAVTHHLVWFPPDETAARPVAPADWGPQLVAALSPAFDAAFAFDPAASDDERGLDPPTAVERAFTRDLAHVPRVLRLAGPAVMVYVLRPFETRPLELPPSLPTTPCLPGRALLVWAVGFGVLMLLAFLLSRLGGSGGCG